MAKIILLTGATRGIGLEAAKKLASDGHTLLVHGRDRERLETVRTLLEQLPNAGRIIPFCADLARPHEIEALAEAVAASCARLDVVIHNAGVLRSPTRLTPDGLEVRFAFNTIAPYLLTKRLLARIERAGRVIAVASAAQARVEVEALTGKRRLTELEAYAQSKLALIMWSFDLARRLPEGPAVIALNPGSLLATRMVREAFGIAGRDVQIGADALVRAALAETFAGRSGSYYDNDSGRFADPHPDALDARRCAELVAHIERLVQRKVKPE